MAEHRVTAYARAVVAGRILAGRLVRLAAQRHLDDLRELTARGYRFSPEHADHAINFFPTYLRLYDAGEKTGQPFELGPAWVFIVGCLYGWLGPDGYRRFRMGYIEIGKGNVKSMVLAGLELYAATCDDEPGAQIFTAAVTREQAHIIHDDAVEMAKASPVLSKRLKLGLHNIYDGESKSYIRPISSEGRSLDGKRVHFAGLDEVHEHRTAVVVTKMRAGLKGRRQGLVLCITNSGYDRTSVCWELHERTRHVLEGTEENETWFGYVCQLDVCESCRKKGYDMPQDGCRACDDWREEAVWLKTNPELDRALPRAYLRQQRQDAIDMPSVRNFNKRVNWCIWTTGEIRWFTAEEWARGSRPLDPAALIGRPCVAGLDLASTTDQAALVLTFPDEHFFVEAGTDPEAGDAADRVRVRGGCDVLAFYWCPEESILLRSRRDQVPYDLWREQHHLEATPGATIDYRWIRRRINGLRERGYQILEICYDQHFAQQLADQLRDEDGFTCVPVPQSKAYLNEPCAILEKLVKDGGLRHGGHPILAWNAANVTLEVDSGGRRHPSKSNVDRLRIDGISALVTGLKRVAIAKPVPMGAPAFIGPPRATASMPW